MKKSTDFSAVKAKTFKDLKVVVPMAPPSAELPLTTTTDGARAWFEANLRRARNEGVFVINDVLTCSLARLLLDNNPDNRAVSPAKVAEMATDIRSGAFNSMNGQTIHISMCGLLNDGQHRCHAVLEAVTDIPMRFMFGLKREDRLTIDQGKQRTAGDYLTMDGVSRGPNIAAIAAMLAQWRTQGAIRSAGGASPWRMSRSEIAAYGKANELQIRNTLEAIRSRPGISALGGISLLGFCHLLFAEKNFAAATDFIDRMVSGSELAENSPINRLRTRLLTEKRLRREEKFELIVRAWNAWRRNDTPKTLMVNKKIPVIEG